MVSVHSFTEKGDHQQNEDAFQVQAHPLDPRCWLCFLADGQGGRAGGGPAATLACQIAMAAACKYRPDQLTNPAAWMTIFGQADAAVSADAIAGFTTLVGVCHIQDRVIGASSGDSAALLISGATVNNLTVGQRKNPPVGSGGAIATPFSAAAKTPWRLVVMSDGVWKYVGWDRVAEVALRASGAETITDLQCLARLPRSGQFQDDFTVVLLEVARDRVK